MTQSGTGLSLDGLELLRRLRTPKFQLPVEAAGFSCRIINLDFPPSRPGFFLLCGERVLDVFSTCLVGRSPTPDARYHRGLRVLTGFFNPDLDLNLIGTSCLPVAQCSRQFWIRVTGFHVSVAAPAVIRLSPL